MNANALRGEIARRGYTQGDVAKKIGISPKAFSQKINGKRQFKMSEAEKMVALLDIKDPAAIFFGKEVT